MCKQCLSDIKRQTVIDVETFVKRCEELYPNSPIDFNKIEGYTTISQKETATFYCTKHGRFEARPKNMLYSSGGLCPKCKEELKQ